MDNNLPHLNKGAQQWRCVDWSTEKANDRFIKNKNRYDPYIYDFTLATNGIYTPDEQLVIDQTDKRPCVFRGLGKSPHIKACIKNNIDYMYIDTGYFGNEVTKIWHRVAYNNLQTLHHLKLFEIQQRLKEVLKRTDAKFWLEERFKDVHGVSFDEYEPFEAQRGETILVVPPSQKVFNHFGGDAEEYTKKLIKEIKTFTDRPIELRRKVGRDQRVKYTVQDQLKSGNYHCIVTYNSIASMEAITVGIPAVVTGPNAGSFLSEKSLKQIDSPYIPSMNAIKEHVYFLTLCQLKSTEFRVAESYKVIKALQGDQKPYVSDSW
tara:strand:+ start:2765 stop:3724 length:960 start_codon:yes stop_codon:yes gene_type:complete